MYSLVFYITFIPLNFPSNYLIEEKGLRVAVVVMLFVATVGTWMRLTFHYSTIIAIIG